MDVHLVDGTYELFRYHFALPSHVTADGREVAAARGVAGSVLSMLEEGATHVAVATDHVIESFRNDLWPTYKDGSGVEADLLSQFGLVEDLLRAVGVTVFAMVEFEADDALGAAARVAAVDDRVDRVVICTPDKDLGQCVGGKIVQMDRRKGTVIGVEGVREKFGVGPESIPDYLALVGDTADGFPGLPGWGPSRPPPSWPATATWRTSPPGPTSGTSPSAARGSWPAPSRTSSPTPSCSAASPPSSTTLPPWTRSTSSSGTAPAPTWSTWPRRSTPRAWSTEPPASPPPGPAVGRSGSPSTRRSAMRRSRSQTSSPIETPTAAEP